MGQVFSRKRVMWLYVAFSTTIEVRDYAILYSKYVNIMYLCAQYHYKEHSIPQNNEQFGEMLGTITMIQHRD